MIIDNQFYWAIVSPDSPNGDFLINMEIVAKRPIPIQNMKDWTEPQACNVYDAMLEEYENDENIISPSDTAQEAMVLMLSPNLIYKFENKNLPMFRAVSIRPEELYNANSLEKMFILMDHKSPQTNHCVSELTLMLLHAISVVRNNPTTPYLDFEASV